MTEPAATVTQPAKIRRGCVMVDPSKRWKPGPKPDPNARHRQPKKGTKPHPPLMEHRPEALVKVVTNVASNLGSVGATAAATGLSDQTVEAILSRNPEAVADCEKHLSRRFLALADRALTHSGANLERLNAYQAMLVAGISVDKHVALVTKGNPSIAIQINLAASIQQAQRDLELLITPPSTTGSVVDVVSECNSTGVALNEGQSGKVVDDPSTTQPTP